MFISQEQQDAIDRAHIMGELDRYRADYQRLYRVTLRKEDGQEYSLEVQAFYGQEAEEFAQRSTKDKPVSHKLLKKLY